MNCDKNRNPNWAASAPFFPFVVAAWVSEAVRRRGEAFYSMVETLNDEADGFANCDARSSKGKSTQDIVETAQAAGTFGTLLTAAQAAGLVDTLQGKGPLTLFAPTDEAFDRLPEGALEELLEDKAKLADVLTFHVVPGLISSAALSGTAALKTALGQDLPVDTKMGVKIGSSYVLQADIETSNGVIHAIDSVLIPD